MQSSFDVYLSMNNGTSWEKDWIAEKVNDIYKHIHKYADAHAFTIREWYAAAKLVFIKEYWFEPVFILKHIKLSVFGCFASLYHSLFTLSQHFWLYLVYYVSFLFFLLFSFDWWTYMTEYAIVLIISSHFHRRGIDAFFFLLLHKFTFCCLTQQLMQSLLLTTDVRKSTLMWHALYQHNTIFIIKFNLVSLYVCANVVCSSAAQPFGLFLSVRFQFAA